MDGQTDRQTDRRTKATLIVFFLTEPGAWHSDNFINTVLQGE